MLTLQVAAGASTGTGALLLHQAPGSTAWDSVALPPGPGISVGYALWATPPSVPQSDVYLVCDGGKYYQLLEGEAPPAAVNPHAMQANTPALAISGYADPSGGGSLALCAVGYNDSVHALSSNQGGDFVSTTLVPASTTLHGVWQGTASVIVAVGSAGTILRGSACNETLVKETSAFPDVTFYAVWGTSPTDVYAVGSGGTIVHSTTPGVWVQQQSGTTKDLHGIFGTSASDIYVVGDRVILHKKK
jgi:hypothetical protein